ncbi:MAG: SPOR domain-containing protein [Bacteroidetes bacterium]|nr:SPOR domain-containing protein [Bacteroidota bacterium]
MRQSTSVIFLAVLFFSCAETKTIQQEKSEPSVVIANNSEQTEKITVEETIDFDKYRTKLGDNKSGSLNTLPNAFVVEETNTILSESDNSGYRIQLISTSDRNRAQKIIGDFNDWIFSSEDIAYKAEAYLIYRQPNYRVHIGDFKTRIQANEFVKFIKRRFNDAWIIQDQIIEDRVPEFVK